jgi:hypothetical protein
LPGEPDGLPEGIYPLLSVARTRYDFAARRNNVELNNGIGLFCFQYLNAGLFGETINNVWLICASPLRRGQSWDVVYLIYATDHRKRADSCQVFHLSAVVTAVNLRLTHKQATANLDVNARRAKLVCLRLRFESVSLT